MQYLHEHHQLFSGRRYILKHPSVLVRISCQTTFSLAWPSHSGRETPYELVDQDLSYQLALLISISKMNIFLLTPLANLIAIVHPTQPLTTWHQTPPRLHSRDLHSPITRRSHLGKMTYYTPGQGSCGAVNSVSDLVVAIPASLYGTDPNPNASPMCQKTAAITCNGKVVKAAVKDKCLGCGGNDIDVSPAVFRQCGDLGAGTMAVSWDLN